jgi:hypothetical protein
MDWDYTEHLSHISRAPASRGADPDGCPNSSLEAWYRYDAAKQRVRKRVKKKAGLWKNGSTSAGWNGIGGR